MAEQKVRVTWQGREVDGVVVPVNTSHEHQASYILADHTALSMRTVVIQVIRLIDEYTHDGDPIYLVKSQNIVSTSSPESLRKKPDAD